MDAWIYFWAGWVALAVVVLAFDVLNRWIERTERIKAARRGWLSRLA